MAKKYKMMSLFSGAGGLDLGFCWTGKYELLLANDIKDFMAKTFSINFGAELVGSIRHGRFPQVVLNDVSNVDFQALGDVGVDVIVGGPPCQDFSVLRSSTTERSGIMVKRGRLYGHFVRALVQMQPKAFVFENVPGLVTANCGAAYETIIKDFSNLDLRWDEVRKAIKRDNFIKARVQGYDIIFNGVVNASDFGVPQARKRLIIVGLRKDLAGGQNSFAFTHEFKKVLYQNKIFKKYPLTTMETFEGKTVPDLQNEYEEIMKEYDGIWEEVSTFKALKWKREVWDRLTFDVVKDYLLTNNITPFCQGELEIAFKEHENLLKEIGYLSSKVSELKFSDGSDCPAKEDQEVVTAMKMIPPDENYEFVVGSQWELRKKGVSQIYRRLHPLKPSYTVVAYGGGGMAMYHYDRGRSALSNREKARLQTFPDWFKFTGSYSNMKAEIGEAVPPLLAKQIAEALSWILESVE